MSEAIEWMSGYYNVCIPVYVDGWVKFPGKRALIRIPLPYKLGEEKIPAMSRRSSVVKRRRSFGSKSNAPRFRFLVSGGLGSPVVNVYVF